MTDDKGRLTTMGGKISARRVGECAKMRRLRTGRRITTTFEPQVNPALDDNQFRFAVPSLQK